MQMMTDENDDKRDFFRIQDRISLEYRHIAGPEGESGFAESSPVFELLSELHVLDYESQHLLRQIAERDRSLASYLKIINKRIDLIGRAISESAGAVGGELTEVTLSEGGMAFLCGEPLEPDSWIAIRMILLSSPLGLVIPARILRSDPTPQGSWTIGVSFEALSDAHRQVLARHILQKQAQEIRAAKTQERTPT